MAVHKPNIQICQIVPDTRDPRGEYLVVRNNGQHATRLTGILLTLCAEQRIHTPVYRFPSAADGGYLMLGPGQRAFVFSGHGESKRLDDGDLLLFASRDRAIWTDPSVDAHLRSADGSTIDSLSCQSQSSEDGPDGA